MNNTIKIDLKKSDLYNINLDALKSYFGRDTYEDVVNSLKNYLNGLDDYAYDAFHNGFLFGIVEYAKIHGHDKETRG